MTQIDGVVAERPPAPQGPAVGRAALRLGRVGTTATFALAGLVSAVGSVRIPALTDKLRLDPGELGVAVLCIGIGAIVTVQAGRALIARYGSRRVLLVACPGTAVLSAASGVAPTYGWLLVSFLAFGAVFGLIDCSMNAQAATLERVAGRHLMNSAHAGWSVGAVTGGGIGALTAYAGLSYSQAVVGTAVLTTPVAVLLMLTYLPDGPGEPAGASGGGASDAGVSRRGAGRVPPVIYLVGAVTFASFVIEGSVASWSGLYLRDGLGAVESVAAFGYPSLELAMIVGRSVGDRVRRAVGSRPMLTASGLVAAAGLALVVTAPGWPLALAGFFVVGLAVSTVVPLTFSIAGALVPSGAGVAQAAAIGYAGMLTGPVLLGFVAQAGSLRATFVAVGGLALAMTVLGRLLPAEAPPGR